LWHKP